MSRCAPVSRICHSFVSAKSHRFPCADLFPHVGKNQELLACLAVICLFQISPLNYACPTTAGSSLALAVKCELPRKNRYEPSSERSYLCRNAHIYPVLRDQPCISVPYGCWLVSYSFPNQKVSQKAEMAAFFVTNPGRYYDTGRLHRKVSRADKWQMSAYAQAHKTGAMFRQTSGGLLPCLWSSRNRKADKSQCHCCRKSPSILTICCQARKSVGSTLVLVRVLHSHSWTMAVWSA